MLHRPAVALYIVAALLEYKTLDLITTRPIYKLEL
jgi:hypothetical protein